MGLLIHAENGEQCWRGAYSAFNALRCYVAQATGGTFPPHGFPVDQRDSEFARRYPKHWVFGEGYDSESHPGLFELLSHSDCDGEIEPGLCAQVADELEALVPTLRVLGQLRPPRGHIEHHGGIVASVQVLIECLREAHTLGTPLRFD